jgi:hypothetical protein
VERNVRRCADLFGRAHTYLVPIGDGVDPRTRDPALGQVRVAFSGHATMVAIESALAAGATIRTLATGRPTGPDEVLLARIGADGTVGLAPGARPPGPTERLVVLGPVGGAPL